MSLEELLEKVKGYLSSSDLSERVEEAYNYALRCHEGQLRRSGEPFLEHPLNTALVVAEFQLDLPSIAAALLHDVVEDCGVSLEEVEAKFGAEVRRLVDGVTKLGRIALPTAERRGDEAQVETLRKMLVAMAEDLRVILIKLADRLHNMQTLEALPPESRHHIARETLDIYAPLAHRLGMARLQAQLEDLAFRHLELGKYREVAALVASSQEAREAYIKGVEGQLQEEMRQAGVKAQVSGRAKHLYSIYTKMEKYAALGKDFSEIHDLLAVRILVDQVPDCYNALGVVHSLWPPIPGTFDDYIATPKENLYQALHTTVLGPQARPLEIQIRTYEMHQIAEYGVAAHWRYKEGALRDMRFEERMAWLRQLLEWHRDLSSRDFLESVKADIFADQVFIYTPKGEVKELPAGATPLDFAYHIHTDLGHRCIGAKVNGRMVPLSYRLQNGDTVEVMAAKAPRGPSRDWLNPHLGYVMTSHSRQKVRQWFRRQEWDERLQQGKAILEKEMRRLGLAKGEEARLPGLFKYDSLEALLAALGSGDVDPHQIGVKLAALEEPSSAPSALPRPEAAPGAVQVLGMGDLLTQMARCCNPVPGDSIIGFITRSRGVTVHRRDCPSVLNEDEKERLISVEWGRPSRLYPVSVLVEAGDRVGLLRDLTTVVSEEKVNIASVSTVAHPQDRAMSVYLTLEITGVAQLSKVLSRLEAVRGVLQVERVAEAARGGP